MSCFGICTALRRVGVRGSWYGWRDLCPLKGVANGG